MPQLAPVTVNDGTKDRTFTPSGAPSGVAELVELNAAGVALARARITVKSSQTTTGRFKSSINIAVPVVQDAVVGGVTRPTVVRTAYVDMTITTDAASTLDERTALRMIAGHILDTANVVSGSIADQAGLY
ncbi:MAG: coat protein [Guiyang fiers-like virus 5]|nr:MAG: coat protein [Guiyang fiers-like virus 5]